MIYINAACVLKFHFYALSPNALSSSHVLFRDWPALVRRRSLAHKQNDDQNQGDQRPPRRHYDSAESLVHMLYYDAGRLPCCASHYSIKTTGLGVAHRSTLMTDLPAELMHPSPH